MAYDFGNVPVAECFKIEFFAMICKRCNSTHPFYINHKGQPCFLTPFSGKIIEFCAEHNIEKQDVINANCFICHCGFPIRFPGIDEEEQKADNKEKLARLKKRGGGKRIHSPKLTVVSEAQAKKIIEAGEKTLKEG